MEYLKIHHCELSALIGLPHLQQLLYLRGLRPFMDSTTGLVGLKRRISYQSLSEELYIEPHQGIKSGSPSKSQIRRALNGLEKAGLIKSQSSKTTLIFQCLLFHPDFSVQIKAVTKPYHQVNTMAVQEKPISTGINHDFDHELNGYWTAYAILYAKKVENLSPLESWIINQAPGFLATQERFGIFQKEISTRLKPGMHIASLPCGLMEDFLSLPPQYLRNLSMTGIDLDEDSLRRAEEIATERNLTNCQFIRRDAWNLDIYESYDLITSNGLNIYEPKTERLIAFYQEIAKALRPDGILITSYLCHPEDKDRPLPATASNLENMLKQKAIFRDIIDAQWQCFQTQESVQMQLASAGLAVEDIIYDSQCMFPTVIAKKQRC